jgi:glycine/D-amino acid oxidase-like deaminating enzyme
MSSVRLPEREKHTIHIIGQGLAGSVLALLLMEAGYKVHVHDDGYQTSSSLVAAGMWNPLSFVNLKVSWMGNEMVGSIEAIYPRLEKILGASFFHPMPLARIFPDAGSTNLWEERFDNPSLKSFMSPESISDIDMDFLQPHGHGVVQRCGWLDMPSFLSASRKYFEANTSYSAHVISIGDQQRWLDQGDWVIQCTGWKKLSDDFGADLPLIPNKGQVYTLEIPGMSEQYMSNFGRFTIPLGKNLFRVGSTYEHRPLDPLPSPAAQEILDDVSQSIKHPYVVRDLKAGYRPTTIDRFPIIGLHQQHERLGIFTGFGSRGVIAVPWCASHFVEHLTEGSPLLPEVDWQRFERRKKRG